MFPAAIIAAAKKSQKETGVLASITLAQWALESGYGKYLAAPFNYFGVKWVKGSPYPFRERLTKEVRAGKWVNEYHKFVAYPSMEEAFAHHGRLLMRPTGPYKKAIPHRNNWQVYLHMIAPIYATDNNYEGKISSIILGFALYELDVAPIAPHLNTANGARADTKPKS